MLDQQQQNLGQWHFTHDNKRLLILLGAWLVYLGPWALCALLIVSPMNSTLQNDATTREYTVVLWAMISAVVSLKWHRIGGVVLILTAGCIFGYSLYVARINQGHFSTDEGLMVFYVLPFLALMTSASGTLHIAYGYMGKRKIKLH